MSDLLIEAGKKRRRPADKPIEVRIVVLTDERRAMYDRTVHEVAEWKAGHGPKPCALYLDHGIEKKVKGHSSC